METAAHPRTLFKQRTLGMISMTLTSSASLRTGVVKTFRCADEPMRKDVIHDCPQSFCPKSVRDMDERTRSKHCGSCDQLVYDTSASPDASCWRRIHAQALPPPQLHNGDTVRILSGTYEDFEEIVDEIHLPDDAALLMLVLFGRHVPFWDSMHNLAPLARH